LFASLPILRVSSAALTLTQTVGPTPPSDDCLNELGRIAKPVNLVHIA
jgi:hypothetical protein